MAAGRHTVSTSDGIARAGLPCLHAYSRGQRPRHPGLPQEPASCPEGLPGVWGRLECSWRAGSPGPAETSAPRAACWPKALARGGSRDTGSQNRTGPGAHPQSVPRLRRPGPLRPRHSITLPREAAQAPGGCQIPSLRHSRTTVDPFTCSEVCVPPSCRGVSRGLRGARSLLGSRPAGLRPLSCPAPASQAAAPQPTCQGCRSPLRALGILGPPQGLPGVVVYSPRVSRAGADLNLNSQEAPRRH